jgi:hypothetical protein
MSIVGLFQSLACLSYIEFLFQADEPNDDDMKPDTIEEGFKGK